MKAKRRKHGAKFKGKIALEALRGDKTVAEIAAKHNIHPTMITRWKSQLFDGIEEIFNKDSKREKKNNELREADLFEEIGRLKFKLDWLKKKLPNSIELKRGMIEYEIDDLSIRRQCELLGLNRASFYYDPVLESEEE